MTSTDALITAVVEQERRLTIARFDNGDAWHLGTILVSLAKTRALPMTLDITRANQQLFHAALTGAAPDQADWIARKNRVVARFGVSPYLAGLRLTAAGQTLADEPWLDPALYATHGGAFPIHITDVGIVGTITVSGLPQADDHALAVEALETFLAGS